VWQKEKEERNKFCFRIKDSGVGIPKKQQKQIFTKFFRSENVLKRQTEGTGLGLFIARAIIQGSDGKIGFNSEENKGTTFWFSLPIAKK
jgi:signal transduction histidine kinase